MIINKPNFNIIKDNLNIIKNILPDDINNIIKEYIEEGDNLFKKNKITHPDVKPINEYINIFDNWSYTIYFTCNLLYFNNIKIKCFLQNKIITSKYSNIINLKDLYNNYIYTYYVFNENENSCVLFYGASYSLPIFIYYFKKNIFFNLIYGNFGNVYNDINFHKKLVDIFMETELPKIELNIANNISSEDTQKLKILSFCNCFQLGHNLWNEVSGLEILIRTNLIKKINILLLGDYDICNMHKIIIEYNPDCKIINIKDKHLIEENYLNIYGIISGYFITNNTKKLYLKNIVSKEINKKNVIMIIIKADRRSLHDIENVYINIINKLVEENILIPNETTIIFDGLYCNNVNTFLESFYNKYKDKYINIVNKIISNISSEFECISLIGFKFEEVLKYYKCIDLWIGVQSSTIELINQTNENGIIIIPENLLYCIQQQCHYLQDRIKHKTYISKYIPDLDLVVLNNFYELYDIVKDTIIKINKNK